MQQQVKDTYKMVREHLFHFTKEGDTEIDLEWSGFSYNEEYNNAQKFKRSGEIEALNNCWHITYQVRQKRNN